MISASEIKKQITTNNIIDILISMGSNYHKKNNNEVLFDSICHDSTSHKLYYYTESQTFYCYSRCGNIGDIFSLVQHIMDIDFIQSLKYVCDICDIDYNVKVEDKPKHIDNWQKDLKKFRKKNKATKELKVYEDKILNFFDKYYCQCWVDDGISIKTMRKYGIRYYPLHSSIVIPTYDKDFNLIGIRERFLHDNQYSMGKYCPLTTLDGTIYKFPTDSILYGLCYNKDKIISSKKIILFEGEKSVMQMDGFYDNDNYSVALLGSNLSKSNLKQLLELGVEEVIIALDFDYNSIENKEFEVFKNKVLKIYKMLKPYFKVSALISYDGHNKKDSASDLGKESFERLIKERIYLNE